MPVRTVYSLDLHLPNDWEPEDRDLFIDDIAEAVVVLDQHHSTLFLGTPEDCDVIELFASGQRIVCERGIWLQLADEWQPNERLFTDYGVRADAGRTYLDLQLAAVVELAASDDAAYGAPAADKPDREFEPALEQAIEHAIAALMQEDGRWLLAVDRHQVDLIAGIARAYRCDFEIVKPAADPA